MFRAWPVGQAVKTLASHAEIMGSIPVRVTKKETSELCSDVSFYPSRRLGMESMRLRIVWNRQRRMASPKVYFLRLDSIHPYRMIPYATSSQFHAATSCGFHPRLRRDLDAKG